MKKGISLIVLIITIIVIVILTSTVILNLQNFNILDKANEAVSLNDLNNNSEAYELYKYEMFLKTGGTFYNNKLKTTLDGTSLIYDLNNDGDGNDEGEESILLSEIFPNSDLIVKIVDGELIQKEESLIQFSSKGLVDSNINYNEVTTSLVNPERGFYKYSKVDVASPYLVSEYNSEVESAGWVISDCIAEAKTLALFKISLEGTKNTDIPSEWLTGLNNIADLYRQAGIKLIVRGDYGNDDPFSEPTDFNQIISHIEQLEDFFKANEDIIHVVEAGFLGKWGEWYYTDHGEDAKRIAVIDKLLEVVPSTRKINVRTPAFYRMKFGDSTFNENTGYTIIDNAKVGIHNDAFLRDDTDSGTYELSRNEELDFLESLTKYTIFGGEAVMGSTGTYNDTANTISEMTILHANYLNGSYDPVVMSKWQSLTDNTDSVYSGQTTYKLIQDRLGYRFVIKNSKLPSSIEAGENLNISVSIQNTGFGNLVNHRDVYLLLSKDNKHYKAKIDTDVKRWFAGETTDINMVFQVPSDIEIGEWNAYIQLPDNNSELLNENFFVKFANSNVWNSGLKANYIGKFDIINGTNNNNNSFYQLNTYDRGNIDYGLTSYITIDGSNTNNEWSDSNKIFDSNGYKIHMDNDEKYLYIYIDNGTLPESYNTLYFDNPSYIDGKERYSNLYKFWFEGNWANVIYEGNDSSTWSDWSEKAVNYDCIISSGVEYKIPLSFLGGYNEGTNLTNISYATGSDHDNLTFSMIYSQYATYTFK